MPCACTANSDGEDWADMFMASVHTNQGLPDRILSDRVAKIEDHISEESLTKPKLSV